MNRTKQPTAERFAADVAQHQMTIIRSNGVDRHLRFKRPGTNCMWFDVLTWSGHLCTTGDMGTYVFARLEDMFEFFRSATGRINPGYWAEKVEAMDKNGKVEEWSSDLFRAAVVRCFRDHWRESTDWADRRECWDDLRHQVLHADGEFDAMQAVSEFECNGFRLTDFWEHNLTEYTSRFIWNLRAIVWAIDQFDAAQAKAAA